MADDVKIGGIGQILIVVRDLTRAIRFYRDTLGLRFLFEAPPALAFFECGGIRLMLAPPESTVKEGQTSILYYRVDDIQSAAGILKSRGVEFGADPHLVARLPRHDLWLAEFRDSEGNAMALMSEVARAG